MARKRKELPATIVAARLARITGANPITAETKVVIQQLDDQQKIAETSTVDTFWQGPDTLKEPPLELSPETDEEAQERMSVWPESRLGKMSRMPQPSRRESKVFRLRAAQQICILISQGQTLQQICGQNGLPSITIVNLWLQDNEKFKHMMDRARMVQADYLADEMLLLAGLTRKDPKHCGAYRVAADILRWQASVRSPRKYGERSQIEVTEVRKTPQQIQREIADLAAEFNVPIADLPINVVPFKKRTGTEDD